MFKTNFSRLFDLDGLSCDLRSSTAPKSGPPPVGNIIPAMAGFSSRNRHFLKIKADFSATRYVVNVSGLRNDY